MFVLRNLSSRAEPEFCFHVRVCDCLLFFLGVWRVGSDLYVEIKQLITMLQCVCSATPAGVLLWACQSERTEPNRQTDGQSNPQMCLASPKI